MPVRVLLPAVSACFSRLAVDGSAGARQLMALLSECVSETELVQLNAELPTLQNLLMPYVKPHRAIRYSCDLGNLGVGARRWDDKWSGSIPHVWK